MTVVVAGTHVSPWCPPEALVGLGGAWRSTAGGMVSCDSPGIYIADGHVRFVLPRCYAGVVPTGAAAVRAALGLFRSLARYRTSTSRAVAEQHGLSNLVEIGKVDAGLAWLEVALQLSEDERRRGPAYVAAAQLSTVRPGRIDWTRTQRKSVHVVAGPEITTSPFWRSRHTIDPDDEFTRLHRDTCAEIRAYLGLPGGSRRRIAAAHALSVLDRCERTLYSDRHKTIARWLRAYWTVTSGARSENRSEVAALFAPSFPHVWEAMLRSVLGGRPLRLPRGTYRIEGHAYQGVRLVPDFTVDVGDTRLVIDAKHYDLDSPPRSESLVKQMLYRWLASEESGFGDIPVRQIESVFVLPAVGRNAPIAELGEHSLDSADEAGFGRVGVVGADFESVSSAYAERRVEPIWARLLVQTRKATVPATEAGGR